MARQRLFAPPSVEVEGNNGGSYIRLTQSETEGMCLLEVGESCVRTIREEVPVTWLAMVLTKAKHDGFESICRAYGADEQFLREVR